MSSFTWKHFTDLNNVSRSYLSPLAVIAHIDLNAFYAQVEQVRLGLSVDDPVVCVQWTSLIAVSYAARKYGISRMDSLDSAKKKCPNLIAAHTAVFKKGETNWKCVDLPNLPSPVDHKVSLDPYRRESRKLMRLFKKNCDLVEKASVDESFMDFGRLVFHKALELFPQLRDYAQANPHDPLPEIPNDLPDLFCGVVFHAEDSEKPISTDWDDVLIMLGSHVANDIRRQVKEEIGYTTSCGVARTKTVSKLASGFKKPDNQTIILNKGIFEFLKHFNVTDFWSMGGKTGDQIMKTLEIQHPNESIALVREKSLADMRTALGDGVLAEKLYDLVRGQYLQPLNSRIDIKSMGSNKNFRGKSVNSLEDLKGWLPIFVADLVQRINELDEESTQSRRPKTLSIHFRNYQFQTWSRQTSISGLKQLDLLGRQMNDKALELAGALEKDLGIQTMYPCSNCGVFLSSFNSLDEDSRKVDMFFKKVFDDGEKDESLPVQEIEPSKESSPEIEPPKASLFCKEEDEVFDCPDCGQTIPGDGHMVIEHRDFHMAQKLDTSLNNMSYGEKMLLKRGKRITPEAKGVRKRGKSQGKTEKSGKRQATLPF